MLLRRAVISAHQLHISRRQLLRCRQFSISSVRRGEIEITVDGKKVKVEQGAALIQACEMAGVQIPRYCYHDKLNIAGNCRMCLVELERSPKPVASCAMPCAPGMVVKTNTPLVHKAREGVMEMLLANHPLDCPICDQGGECDLQEESLRYGSDRGRFHEMTGKRAVEDKDIGPLVKTVMTRCIHCTRCVRFANEVAGAPEFGTTGRGSDMQIGTYLEKVLDTELSGNVIDLCPVGALTSKPYAFKARPWELKKTESIDVLDALGSNIQVHSRGVEVVRVIPRLNDDVNEEWISDKTRFACDGLKNQRLTTPLIKRGDRFEAASWDEALQTIADAFPRLQPKENEIKAVAGHLADAESMVALKDMLNRMGSENCTIDIASGGAPPAHGVDVRSNYLFNGSVHGVEAATSILLIGTNPRHEAAVLNARIRKAWTSGPVTIGYVGEDFDSTFEYEKLGTDLASLKKALSGKFGQSLSKSEKPMIIVGSGVTEHPDAKGFFESITQFVGKNEKAFFQQDWNGYNVLQRAASRPAAFDIGFVPPSPEVASTKPKVLFLLNADEIPPKSIPTDAFVVYHGHHGDLGAQYADVVLPGAAYTEKSATYVNLEGRTQNTRAAVPPPGVAREDWTIIRALSEYLGSPLPYDDIHGLRERMYEISPSLVRYDIIEPASMAPMGLKFVSDANKGSKPTGDPLTTVVKDYYLTDVISRRHIPWLRKAYDSSPTMARCSATYTKRNPDIQPRAEIAYG